MADELAGLTLINGVVKNTAAAILFQQAGTLSIDVYSGVMSSPWSTEKFTATEEDVQRARKYVTHAVILSFIYVIISAKLSESVWPIFGFLIMNAYMIWLYKGAISKD